VFPVRCELGLYIPEDGILCREYFPMPYILVHSLEKISVNYIHTNEPHRINLLVLTELFYP
jgi:hypothetical protein